MEKPPRLPIYFKPPWFIEKLVLLTMKKSGTLQALE